ncbi:hypothetical protein GLAREA_04469 [Glarea lozoyensis ATCC 20868]|uniref:Uncharacterized protein n=1 Tax=Glarea lozoyensis (strain ATCC 20868 / MF5171) TaxID=1116229 RepID=S3DMD4_GLAL2|nr:uncharacterized protein GLAREA_04469 [Glarea lozoyensis ATCC 20868]EPE27678.1 hypothetical protein GLAREA_04469 [Glarea lozoyensis ATCC 20868]
MSLFTAQVRPDEGLGFLVLGATLHDILTRLKAEPQSFPKLELTYESTAPVTEPVVLHLPSNGLRLRFDGPEQRLRLIEVLDFTKSHLTYKDRDILRPISTTQSDSSAVIHPSGPTYKHISRVVGLAYPGEYIEPNSGDESGIGLYVLSYPGLAFSFPLKSSAWSPSKIESLFASTNSPPASSMAIFRGKSWPEAREHLFTEAIDPTDTFVTLFKKKETVPTDIRLVRIHGAGEVELVRSGTYTPLWLQMGQTTPQELVAELGPPDAIYRKNDRRMSIHKVRRGTNNRARPDLTDLRLQDDSTDTDQSSAHTATDDSDDDTEESEVAGNLSGECFYNYFYHGFDILISAPSSHSQYPPSKKATNPESEPIIIAPGDAPSRLVASKIILHGNIPGSYPFNRHRRCRWEIQYLPLQKGQDVVDSETPFKSIEARLHEEWKSIYQNEEEAKARQRGMVLNRDWGDSPGSSCELLGGWEDSLGGKRPDAVGGTTEDIRGMGSTTLFGFPGLVFEVLANGVVSGVTVF